MNNNKNRKSVLVIPGSQWQVPAVRKAKQMGHRVLIVSPSADSPAFEYAEDHLQADIFDWAAVTEYCVDQRIDAVISDQCDIAMPVVASIAQKLSLPSLGTKCADLYTNKFAMRRFCASNDLPCPEFKLCFRAEDIVDLLREVDAKLIIKPVDSNSSRGVFTISTEEEAHERFSDSVSYSKAQEAVIAERYIEGTEFTIDGIKTPQKHFTLAISEKKHYTHNNNIAHELLFSHSNPNYDYEKLKTTNDRFINRSGLPFGLTHAEYKYEDGEYYLIETAARGGGNLVSSDIVPFMSGIDNLAYLIDCSLGKVTNSDFLVGDQFRQRCSVLSFFQPPEGSGKLKRINGIDFLEKQGDVTVFQFNHAEGEFIEPAADDAARIGFYIACCPDRKRLEMVMKAIDDKVTIDFE